VAASQHDLRGRSRAGLCAARRGLSVATAATRAARRALGLCRPWWLGGLAAILLITAAAGPASAVILYGTVAPPASTPPDDSVVRWSSNGSGVVVSPNGSWGGISDYILTVRHPWGDIGTTVTSSTGTIVKTYVVAETFNCGTVDLRIARLTNLDGTPAAMPNATPINTSATFDTSSTPTFAIGGYGVGRGTATGTGYLWADDSTKALRWGTNQVIGVQNGVSPPPFHGVTVKSDCLVSAFGTSASQGSILTDGDSGGGWFMYSPTRSSWVVAGLSAYANYNAAAVQFNPPENFYAIRISSYQNWITKTLNPITWTGSSPTGSWGTTANWSGAASPNGDDVWAVFGANITSPLNVTLDGLSNWVVGTLRFDAPGNVTISSPARSMVFSASNSATGVGIEVNRLGLPGSNGSHAISTNISLAAPFTVNQNSTGDFTISGTISGSRDLTKTGIGTLILSGPNTYSGGTTVSQGTLKVTATGSLGTGAVNVVGGTLSATGTIIPAVHVQSGGTLAHSATGTVQVGKSGTASAMTFDPGATYVARASGTGASQYDRLVGYGTTTISGANLNLGLLYDPRINDSYTLVKKAGTGTISGTFAGLTEQALMLVANSVNGKNHLLQITYAGGAGTDVVATARAPQGDGNHDGSVDGLDYNIWQNGYQQPGATFWTGDYNLDGSVDGLDYNAWQNMYGTLVNASDAFSRLGDGINLPGAAGILATDTGPGVGTDLSATPEPATHTLVALGARAALRRRRRG